MAPTVRVPGPSGCEERPTSAVVKPEWMSLAVGARRKQHLAPWHLHPYSCPESARGAWSQRQPGEEVSSAGPKTGPESVVGFATGLGDGQRSSRSLRPQVAALLEWSFRLHGHDILARVCSWAGGQGQNADITRLSSLWRLPCKARKIQCDQAACETGGGGGSGTVFQ